MTGFAVPVRRLSRFISHHVGAVHLWNVHCSWKLQKNTKNSNFAVQGHSCWHR